MKALGAWERLRLVLRLCTPAAILVVIVGLIWGIISDCHVGCSAALGGFLWILVNAVFAFSLFKYPWARNVNQILRRFYLGEVCKFLAFALMFLTLQHWFVFAYLPFIIGILFASFGLALGELGLKRGIKA